MLWILDVETNPGQQRPFPAVCRMLCSNVLSLSGNLGDLVVASSRYDILLWRLEIDFGVFFLLYYYHVFNVFIIIYEL